MSNKITAWSFSRWKDYQGCPLRAKYKYIDKLKEPSNEAMERGSNIHKMAEEYVRGDILRLPKDLVKFKDDFKVLKKAGAKVEEAWTYTAKWTQTGWFDRDAWLRVKVDAYHLDGSKLRIIDHKTGKRKEDHLDQLSLYALAGMLQFPALQKGCEISTELWYLDSGEKTVQSFDHKTFKPLTKEWTTKTKAMLNDTKFSPKPSYGCTWCPFSKKKGGNCKY